ncbi:Tetratricopeptide TPR_2 repeat protein [Candidatus Magnetobacterium bavaricum]|uniref:Tetratricopeptide TPR_2 repeat protein n=1 Tax=Candidatus Magnetobacterium bavaricum TaxID=29290 RepID=A0A0F3GXY1_9BACT|nr:Tetratricopeptide TPR_2 repeat protein [Candidatus Magnetobacterium bavaricum]
MDNEILPYIIVVVLCALVLVIYRQTLGHTFISYDDGLHITGNDAVRGGLSLKGLAWAFTQTHNVNWMPLVWLSHMLDCQLYGIDPRGHHLTSVLLHTLNTVVLFLALVRVTGQRWPSLIVTALFALHPLDVESVAWASERKNLLLGLLWFLTIWVYGWYVEMRSVGRYVALIVAAACGYMAKPTFVAIPVVLLLLDWWPLKRIDSYRSALVMLPEKLPLVFFSLLISVWTYISQKTGGFTMSLETLELKYRLYNCVISYVRYIGKLLWPSNLAVYYPFPSGFDMTQVVLSAAVLLLLTGSVLWFGRRLPYLITGWFWFICTLLPNIGIVQSGGQAMADRYSYVSFIGLYVIIAWGMVDVIARWPRLKVVLVACVVVALIVLVPVTWRVAGYWRNDLALFGHAAEVTQDNYLAHNNYGVALFKLGRYDEAFVQFSRAVAIRSDYVLAQVNLGNVYLIRANYDKAIDHYNQALKVQPSNTTARYYLKLAHEEQEKAKTRRAMAPSLTSPARGPVPLTP